MLPVDKYNVYWDAGYILEGDFVLLAEIKAFDQFFFTTDDTLMPGMYYKFQVSAVNQIGEGALSEVAGHFAQAKPGKPQAPFRLSSTQVNDTTASITLQW